MIHRYNTIFRNYNYSKNTYKIETRDIAALAAIYGYNIVYYYLNYLLFLYILSFFVLFSLEYD